jgi:hypothetical protein
MRKEYTYDEIDAIIDQSHEYLRKNFKTLSHSARAYFVRRNAKYQAVRDVVKSALDNDLSNHEIIHQLAIAIDEISFQTTEWTEKDYEAADLMYV